MQLTVRQVRAEEYDAVGELTLAAYRALPNYHAEGGYEADLFDARRRAEVAEVFVGLDRMGRVLGGVTYVRDRDNPYAEWDDENAAGIRMLAVAPDAQGRGVGGALVRACIERARTDGKRRLVLHSTPWMTTAHRLYLRLGFRRAAERDFTPLPDVPLFGFELELR